MVGWGVYEDMLKLKLDEARLNAWRAACRYIYELLDKDGPNGKPKDCISRADYHDIIAKIGHAECLEEIQVKPADVPIEDYTLPYGGQTPGRI